MRVVIPDDYQNVVRSLGCFERMKAHEVVIYNDTTKDEDELVRRFEDAAALVLIRERTAITAELLTRLPKLRLIAQTGRGTSHIDVAECEQRGVIVRTGTGSPHAPAELTFALILAASRRIPTEAGSLRAGGWQHDLGRTLRGRTLGIWGLGKIGVLVAGFAKAFGMRILVWGRDASINRAEEAGYDLAGSPEFLFETADVVTLHLRLEPATRGIVTADLLARMKPEALLVNTSRAELIAPGALADALALGRPGFAAVDVYEEEPITGADHPLLHLPNTLCTPHLGYVERDSYELYFGQAFDAVNEEAER